MYYVSRIRVAYSPRRGRGSRRRAAATRRRATSPRFRVDSPASRRRDTCTFVVHAPSVSRESRSRVDLARNPGRQRARATLRYASDLPSRCVCRGHDNCDASDRKRQTFCRDAFLDLCRGHGNCDASDWKRCLRSSVLASRLRFGVENCDGV